jgi:alanyl-tRNA synthetase
MTTPAATDRLYYTDAELLAFDARIVEVRDGGRRVYLDRTAFYPTSGGQPHDTGILAGARVVDVVDEDDRIAHLLAEPLAPEAAAEGTTVRGEIDRERRRDHMQQHTGQHLLSAVAEDRFGWHTASVHFGRDASTIDLAVDSAEVTPERVVELERLANRAVTERRAVSVAFEDAATAQGLRKRPAREGAIRVVTIEGLDRGACGGTHVATTGEIGAVLLRRVERVKQGTRVEFLCGERAVRRARADFELLSRLAQRLSAAPEEIPALVEALQAERVELSAERKALAEEVATYRARSQWDAEAPAADGVRRIVERRAGGDTGPDDADEVRLLASAFAALPRTVFVGAVEAPPLLVLAVSPDTGLDAGRLLKGALGALGGRGGGAPKQAQGTVADAADLARAVDALLAATAPKAPGGTT